MNVFFVKATADEPLNLPFYQMAIAPHWQRPLAVAIVAVLTALLHGLLLVWYLNRPAPPVVTEAMSLPMIDIALAAPASVSAKAVTPPAPPKPIIKPPEKQTKPKPAVKPKAKSEIKKKIVKPETKQKETPPPAAPALSQPAPVTPAPARSAPTESKTQSTPVAKDVPANANAAYLNNPKPNYPRMARQRHWEGRVVLRVFVTADGHCGDLSVQRSSGHEALDEAAMDAVRQWRFVPGKHGDTAVASWVNVPIEFALE
jgi:protein TonB